MSGHCQDMSQKQDTREVEKVGRALFKSNFLPFFSFANLWESFKRVFFAGEEDLKALEGC